MKPTSSQPGVFASPGYSLSADPLGREAHQDESGDYAQQPGPKSPAPEQQSLLGDSSSGREREECDRSHGAEGERGAEDVQEQRQVPGVGTDRGNHA